jgi:hypothetical protein
MALEDAKNPIKGVSGPGKYAKRLDRIPANQYGDQTQIADIASGAPLAKTPDTRGMPMSQIEAAAAGAPAQQPLTSLYAPTERPGEPVTHGIDRGPGGGSNVLNLPNPAQAQYTTAYDMINQWAQAPDASPTLQYLAQRIKQGF